MDFLFQISCDNKTQQILQETNALKVVDQLAGFFYLYKKQANYSTGNLTTNLLFFKGYLCYKMTTSQNVPSKAQIKNFFIS